MNIYKINSKLPFCAEFYTRMPNEKDLILPFEQKTKNEKYYALNHSFISRSRLTNDVFQLLDPDLEIVDKLEVNYTVDSFTRTKEENVNKLVDIFDVLLAKVKLADEISQLKLKAFSLDSESKLLKNSVRQLEDSMQNKVAQLMKEKNLTTIDSDN
ncbi:MAG: hypothetical protein E7Z87_04285 [Cyanobacteria bacterium SIG26]|nr:hypothetical protein [Cyanobacteria bacterium SIG26]